MKMTQVETKDGYMFDIATTCPSCGKVHTVRVKANDYYKWTLEGLYIQDAFPYLTASERELLQTGICPDCWNKIFSDKD